MTGKSCELVNETLIRKQHFLKLAIQTLVRNGGIATVQADYIRRLLAAMKMDAEYTILPGSTTIYMKEEVSPTQGQNVLTFKTALGWNFDRLEDVEEILNDVMSGKLIGGLDDAISGIEKVARRPNIYGPWIHPVAWSIIGCAATILLRGRLIEGLVALVTGLVFGLALISLDVAPILGFTFDFWISFVVALMLGITQAFIVKDLIFWPTFLASVILILPGFSMSMGFTDVFSRNTIFGLTTLFNAAWTAVSIGVGAFSGIRAASSICMREIVPLLPGPSPYSDWVHIAIYPVFNVLLNMTFQAKPLQAVIISPMATATFALFLLFIKLQFSDEPNILLCILFMGIIGHVYGRLGRISELPTILSGIIVFAPGTYGARCAYYAMHAMTCGDYDEKLKHAIFAFQQGAGMITVSAAMALGLLLSRVAFGRL